jgi:RND family efflux transporter MFP subunit
MRHTTRWVAAVAVTAAFAACKEQAAPPPAPPPKVTVGKPELRTVRDYRDFTGTTRAIEFSEIRARVSGTLQEKLFEASSVVEKDAVLFRIEPETYQAAFDEAQATKASAESQLASAKSDLERVEQAIQSNAVSAQDVDRARAARDQAESAVMAAQARLDKATVDLGYTNVRSPIKGQVSRRFVDLGNLVGYGEPTLLTTVTRIQPIYVYFDVPEDIVLQMLKQQREGLVEKEPLVYVATADDEGFPHEGRVDYIDNTVDSATGTIEIRAVLSNEDHLLFPGLFVRVRAVAPERQALVIDERAVGSDLGGKYVFVVGDDDVVEQRYVTLGPVQDDGTAVVEEGLEGTERYITEGLLRARPGMPVDSEVEKD